VCDGAAGRRGGRRRSAASPTPGCAAVARAGRPPTRAWRTA
jgi:hypothetical protein